MIKIGTIVIRMVVIAMVVIGMIVIGMIVMVVIIGTMVIAMVIMRMVSVIAATVVIVNLLNVGLDERRVSAEVTKLGRKLLAGILVAAGNDEPGAFLCESDSGRATDAGQRTCDQDNGAAHGPGLYGVALDLKWTLTTV